MNHTKKIETLEIGNSTLNLEAEVYPSRTVITSYYNNLSVRGYALHLKGPQDRYIDAVIASCGLDDDSLEDALEATLEHTISLLLEP